MSDKDILSAIEKAQKEAEKYGTEKNGIAIVVNVKTDKNATSLEIIISKASMDALIKAGAISFTIQNGLSTITFDLAVLKALSGGEVKLSISKVDPKTLSAEAQSAIGNRPVLRYSVTVGGKAVTNFGGGRVGLQIPYIHSTTEQSGNLCGVFVDAGGKVTWMETTSYAPHTGMMLISTTHFSVFGVGYKQNTPTFTDTTNHWAKDDIQFVAARGLLTGDTATTFSPDTSMTRKLFVTALGRLAGIDTNSYKTSSFTDVAADSYFLPYAEWAVKNNIVTGTSATTFAPDQVITREEMAMMIANYAKAIGYKLPSVHKEIVFTDNASIDTLAKIAVKEMQMAGILMGKADGKFDPTGTATRAEVSAMLHRFVELMANSETSEGWVKNDSGNWMYFESGKAITGKKNIDGTTYEFNQYGVTTLPPKDRRYAIYTVKNGDSFWAIASKHKVNIFELASLNGKTILSTIHPGDELKIPQK